jgi:hypothetical protein
MNQKFNDYIKIIVASGCFILLFTLYLLIYDSTHFSGVEESDDKTIYDKIFNRLYFTVTTLSSTGSEDNTAKSKIMKINSIILQFILIVGVMGGLFFSIKY